MTVAAVIELRDRDDRRVFVDELRRAVKEEVREVYLLNSPGCTHDLPPPNALAEERKLVGALLAGTIRVTDVAPVTASDMYSSLHSAVVIAAEVLGLQLTISAVVHALRVQGFGGQEGDIHATLEDLVLDAPVVVDLEGCKRAILNAAERRRLIRVLQDAVADLRLGRRTAGQVLETLREATVG